MKTFSFIDKKLQDFIRYIDTNEIVKIKASNTASAADEMFAVARNGSTNWTNTGTRTWCWEDM